MDRARDLHMRLGVEHVDAIGPRLHAPVAEPQLHALERAADPALEVARIDEHDAQAGVSSCRNDGMAHRVRVAVPTAARVVMHVVELPYRRDARERHLPIGRTGEGVQRVGVEQRGELVHLVAPRPERPLATVRARSQRPVEHVGVRVHETGDRHAGTPLGVSGTRAHTSRHRPDPRTVDLDDDARLDVLAAEPCPLAPQAAHVSRIGTRTPRSSATSTARS